MIRFLIMALLYVLPTHVSANDWPIAAGDLGSQRHSPLTQISPKNVDDLGAAWVHKFDGMPSRATPVVVNDRMFLTAGSRVFSLDAKTGGILWEHSPKVGPSALFKGVAVGEGLVFYGTVDAHLVALDENTGKQRWSTLIGDELPDRAAHPLEYITTTGQTITAAPTYVDGSVISGMSGGDWGVRGRVVALDAKTGKIAWTFFAVPGPGEKGHETWPAYNDSWKRGGGAVWSTPNVDTDLNLVVFVVGNPVPQWGGEVREGENLFTDSVVALDLETGDYRWHYQLVHHDIWEADIGTPPVFYEAKIGGETVPAVGVMRTDGYLFLLDRTNGKPIYPVEERPVPQNERLKTHPTQPFPVGADQFGPNCVKEGVVPEGFVRLCTYEPVDYDLPNGVYPLMNARSSPMSYDKTTHTFIIAGTQGWPLWIRRFQDPGFFQLISAAIPGQKLSGGLMAAIDAESNKIVWQNKTPYDMHNGSGATTTSSGLIFHGEPDGQFQALDTKTGQVLWQFQTGANATGPASIYEIDGEQFIATISTTNLWAFKLGGTVEPYPAPKPPALERGFSGRAIPTNKVTMGATIEDMGLEKVRLAFDEHAFSPARIRISAGDKVTWTNSGTSPHVAAAMDGSWTTGKVPPGESATVKFERPGRFTYYCDDHPWSFGEVIVQ
ncbi:MAG: hypothetical protein CMG46_04140 [Candidatus Marinimicrobia bacterium]|nr:hypothetical protein [Candidatus Neomarinimicrobiota bacterium]